MKEYKSLGRMKLPAILSVMSGEAIINDNYITKDEVIAQAVWNATTQEDMLQIIKYGYKYMPHQLTIEGFTDFCMTMKKSQTSRWFSDGKKLF